MTHAEMLAAISGQRIAVIGDLMLDRYIIGDVNRISPEAPVPVVDVADEYVRFGGAANVCLNIQSLGAQAVPFGVIGDDTYGDQFRERSADNGIDISHIIAVHHRPTTVKTRIIGGHQQIVRIDREVKDDIAENTADVLIENFKTVSKTIDAVIFQDYNKGVITESVIQGIISHCREAGIRIFVDPKQRHFFDYRDVFLFKPNRRETIDNLHVPMNGMMDYKSAATELKSRLNAKNILITLSEDGMLLLDSEGEFTHVPTTAAEVLDVSGAGDTVIATLTTAVAAGVPIPDAVRLANDAAGVVIRELGIVPIRREQLL